MYKNRSEVTGVVGLREPYNTIRYKIEVIEKLIEDYV